MSLLRRALGREDRSIVQPDVTDAGWGFSGGWGPGMVWQGPPDFVGGRSSQEAVARSMRLSAVFACLRLISEAISTLPLDTFVRQSGVRRPYRPRPDYLSFQPPQSSRVEYLSQLVLSLLTDGNAYVLTPRDRLGVPVDLVVLDPTLLNVSRLNGRVQYEAQGQLLDPAFDLLHIKGMTLPGQVKGLSPIAYARETIGLGLAAQQFGAAFFGNGALPGAVIEAPGEMTQPAAERFKAAWDDRHGGIGNAHRIGVLTNGAKLTKVSIAPNDAQFLETRAFQVPDVARIFGVPPHLIADASNSTSWGSGLAEQNLAFGQFSLRPWIERIEEAHTRLLTTQGLDRVFIKLNMDALLRAKPTERYQSYATAIENRFMTINEVRALEDMPPVPWGDEPFVPERITEQVPAPTGDVPPLPPTEKFPAPNGTKPPRMPAGMNGRMT